MWDAMDLGNLSGKTVLDIGAADGWFSIASAASGAAEVTAIDKDYNGWDKNIKFLSSEWKLPVKIATDDFRNTISLEKYDIILFLGVIYHIEDVFSTIKKLRRMLNKNGRIIIETQVTTIESDRPIFETASDVFPTTAPQGVDSLNQVGVSNYLFPNKQAVEQLAHMYHFECISKNDSEYTMRYKHRHIYEFRKIESKLPRWKPQIG